MRIVFLANKSKPDAVAAGRDLAARIKADYPKEHEICVEDCFSRPSLDKFKPDLIVILGGDGTILEAARHLVNLPASVLGINFGKLGYLAAFSVDQFIEHLPLILSGKAPVTHRLMLHGAIHEANSTKEPVYNPEKDHKVFECAALNDVVLNAGMPFRLVELTVRINGEKTTTFRSDGIIVSTSSGSTGYNLSAGGPLISPELNALVITPICAYSLSFRPVVMPGDAHIVVIGHRVNPGTMVMFDGQVAQPLLDGQYLSVRRTVQPLRLVENPSLTHWQMLANKLHWAQSPHA
ncbi:MAG TPA: NAD(+)/NADH kinase [Phycisphaerae bacterium]|nr:NAD(+)/NADH kinase [Phycisphaerae bacterium]